MWDVTMELSSRKLEAKCFQKGPFQDVTGVMQVNMRFNLCTNSTTVSSDTNITPQKLWWGPFSTYTYLPFITTVFPVSDHSDWVAKHSSLSWPLGMLFIFPSPWVESFTMISSSTPTQLLQIYFNGMVQYVDWNSC